MERLIAIICTTLLLHSNFGFSQNPDTIICKKSLLQNVTFLASDSLQGRYTGSLGAMIAANYIKENFQQHNVLAISTFPNYCDSFKVDNVQGINVVGAVKGYGSDSLLIISAHYDHIGQGSTPFSYNGITKDDVVFNGANDNATGTAAMMEIAKYFAATKKNYYTILFVAFSGEELGMKGSSHFITQMANPGMIKSVINLEMLGVPFDKKYCFYTDYVSYKTIKAMNKLVQKNTGQRNFFRFDSFPEQQLNVRSDHYSFKNYVQNTFTFMATSPYNEHYHSVTDESSTIDFDYLLKVTKNIVAALNYFSK